MYTFKNTSDQVFQDGDLLVQPGDSFSTEEENRAEQMRVQYAWQFEETSDSKSKDAKNAPSEEQIKSELPAGNIRELRTGGHVAVDDEGKQSEKVGQ